MNLQRNKLCFLKYFIQYFVIVFIFVGIQIIKYV